MINGGAARVATRVTAQPCFSWRPVDLPLSVPRPGQGSRYILFFISIIAAFSLPDTIERKISFFSGSRHVIGVDSKVLSNKKEVVVCACY